MTKKFVFLAIIAVLALASLGIFSKYAAMKEREKQQKAKQLAKAPEETITIIEGWTSADIGKYLEKKGVLPADEFFKLQSKYDTSKYPILKSLPAKSELEGFLFPDTYRIPKSTPDNPLDAETLGNAIIKKLLDNFSSKFTAEMEDKARQKNMTVFQVVTLASIIERETGRNAVSEAAKQQLLEERKIVSGIFQRRLADGHPLESDATINFITKKNTPSSSAEDLGIDSPYNTYKYKGLPPGPIDNPSLSSIKAVLEPAETDYYFFLHKQPSGEAVFSKTYDEHLRNKYRYLK